MESADIDETQEGQGREHGGLISILEEIQSKYSYLPEEALRKVAEESGKSLADVYGVATFYRAFSLKPRGKHLVSVCLGTACHVRGAPMLAEEVAGQLGIRAGETTSDNEFTLETVNCLGACALGPVMVVDGRYFPKVKASTVRQILDRVESGFAPAVTEVDERVFPLDVSCARCNHTLIDPRHLMDGYPVIRVTVAFNETHGRLTLSSLYGSYKADSEFPIPPDTVVQMFCPHCHAELIGGGKCPECGIPMVPMIVRGGGVVQICPRKGCHGHILDLGGATIE